MGNNDSKQDNSFLDCLQNRKMIHPLLGDLIQAVDNSKKTKHWVKTFTTADPNEHRDFVRKLKQRKLKNNKYVLNVSHVQDKTNNEFCSINCSTYVCFDYFESDLQSIYEEKQNKKKSFTEEDLFDILKQTVNALIFIQDNGLKHYYLNKKSIVFISKELRLLDTTLVGKTHPYFDILNHEDICQDIFLSPETVQELKNESFDPYISPKSDIFSLAVLVLHLACMQSLASYFDYQEMEVDTDSLLFKISKIKYSEWFKDILTAMMQPLQQDRPGLITLQDKLENCKDVTKTQRSLSLRSNARPSTKRLIKCVGKSQLQLNHEQIHKLVPSREQSETDCQGRRRQPSFSNQNVNSNLPTLRRTPLSQLDQCQNRPHKPEQLGKRYKTIQSYNDSPIHKIDLKEFTKINYKDGRRYEGQAINDVPNGNGILYEPNGTLCYSGTWKDDMFHGYGNLYNQYCQSSSAPLNYHNLTESMHKWSKYQGQFQSHQKHGYGTLYFVNGQKFTGFFNENDICGFGTYYLRNGQINGVWDRNILKT